MLCLSIRTDKPEAELGLYEDTSQLAYQSWQAHRQLAETIHLKIKELLDAQHKSLHEITAIVVFQGPGSFTGLRIGISVANALAASLPVAIVATQTDNWISLGLSRLLAGENQQLTVPEYGALPNITVAKK